MTPASAAASVEPTRPSGSAALESLALLQACLTDLVWLTSAASKLQREHATLEVHAHPRTPLQAYFDVVTRDVGIAPWLRLPGFSIADIELCVHAALAALDDAHQRLTRGVSHACIVANKLLVKSTEAAARRALDMLETALLADAGLADAYLLRARAHLQTVDAHEAQAVADDAEWARRQQEANAASAAATELQSTANTAQGTHTAAVTALQTSQATLESARAATQRAQMEVNAKNAAVPAPAEAAPDGAVMEPTAEQAAAAAALAAAQAAEAAAAGSVTTRQTECAAAAALRDASAAEAHAARVAAQGLAQAARRPALEAGPGMLALKDVNRYIALRSYSPDADTMEARAQAIAAVRRELERRARVNRTTAPADSVLSDEVQNASYVTRHRRLARLLPNDEDAFSYKARRA